MRPLKFLATIIVVGMLTLALSGVTKNQSAITPTTLNTAQTTTVDVAEIDKLVTRLVDAIPEPNPTAAETQIYPINCSNTPIPS